MISSILNQDKRIKVTSNSITCEIVYQIQKLKEDGLFINFPDSGSLDNVINNVFNMYYKDWKANTIIDRSSWGTPANLFSLRHMYKSPKFIILYRPVIECLSSYVKALTPGDLDVFCEEVMDKDNGVIGKNLWSIENILKNKEDHIIIHFKDFINNPIKELKKIYKYTNNKYKDINLKNFKQFSINNIHYNDKILGADIHKIRTSYISHTSYDYKKILSSKIINKYKNRDVL